MKRLVFATTIALGFISASGQGQQDSLKSVSKMQELQEVVVKGMVAIFTYGLDVAAKNFEEAKVELHTLTNYDTLIEVACQEEYIRAADQESLANWRKNPEAWSDAHMA